MAETAAAFLGPIIEVAKWVAAPIKRQFNYLCCFSSNITTLKHEAGKLQDTTGNLQTQVNSERNNGRVIINGVENWLMDSKAYNDEGNKILGEVSNVESGCLKLTARFSLSKRAKKTSDHMKEHGDQCKFGVISLPRPPAATKPVPVGTTYEFESRKQIEEDIMTTLRDGDVNTMGICGMGGLGKTTMAKRIMNNALKENVFGEAVFVVVSQPANIEKIQLGIGGSLGLDLKGVLTSEARAQELCARLTLTGRKRILLVLDDVWEILVLEHLGIPCGYKKCTILLTSRNHDVLSSMNVQKVVRMQVLSEEDAWFLFKERAGTCVDGNKLNSIAQQVVKQCKGLPIALTTVGAALKDENEVRNWKDALRQLQQCDPHIPGIIANVYNPLKISYDVLGSKHKSVFLLCCLFPEDDNIPLEYLTYFCMGLGIFERGIRNVEDGRNLMCALTTMLKSRSLLLDSNEEDHVRMHDVVRDVCIFIAKKEGHIGDNDGNGISSFLVEKRTELLNNSGFPNLRRLFLIRNFEKEESKFDITCFEGLRDLYVLFSIGYYSLKSLPQTTGSLKNLNTLLLDSCGELETISVVGELVNLEILICRNCHSIEELPPKIKGLNRLKLLELTGCANLKRIGRGIISSLVGLEELKMLWSFNKWEAEDREERENAGLIELAALTNLRCLEIEIGDTALAAEDMELSSKIEIFDIRIPPGSEPHGFDSHLSNKKMSLHYLDEGTCLGHWIELHLLRDAECLCLSGNFANNLNWVKIQDIRWLQLSSCQNMKNIVTTSMDDDGRYGGATLFSSIEYLRLSYLDKLEEILDGSISSNSFQNLKQLNLCNLPVLKEFWKSNSLRQNNYVVPIFSNLSSIEIRCCSSLSNLGQLSMAGKDCLLQLEILHIEKCEMMEQVFLWNDSSESRNHRHIPKILFPKLKKVKLDDLPNLTTFYQGIIQGIEFPLLTGMHIEECPKMKSMVSIGMGSNENNSGGSGNADIDGDHASSHSFCQVSIGSLQKLFIDTVGENLFGLHKFDVSSFNKLEELVILRYEGSMSLFTSSIAGNLVNLKHLRISRCNEMVQVIEDEEKVVSGGERNRLFPCLQRLWLRDLRKLVSFCEWKCDVELPSLTQVGIHGCPNMRKFTLAAPNLEAFETDLNNDLEVSFGSLKKFTINGNKNPFYRHKISMSLFNGLEVLTISAYHGPMSLFSYSIAANLVNLKELSIRDCDGMVQVIKDDEEEEEKALTITVSGGERTLVFPNLQKLKLMDLRKLVSFCKWKCDVELPSLRKVKIDWCYNMKNFTLGPLTTPNLKIVKINYEDFGATKDLNGALHQQHSARAKEEEEDDGSEENQEKKDEIEEEQN